MLIQAPGIRISTVLHHKRWGGGGGGGYFPTGEYDFTQGVTLVSFIRLKSWEEPERSRGGALNKTESVIALCVSQGSLVWCTCTWKVVKEVVFFIRW